MSEVKAISGAGGTVQIGTRTIFVEPLPFRQEVALVESLRKLAKEQSGDFLKAVEPTLDRLDKMKTPAAAARAAIFIETVARMEARGELPGEDAAETARRTPKGVALELWYRSRRLHPTVELPELEAVITGVNAESVHWQIREALGSTKDDSKSGSGGDRPPA